MANTTVNNIRRKNIIRYNNDLCLVLECQVRTPPNNASYCQMELRSFSSGRVIPVRTNIGASFDVLENSIKHLELLYQADGNYVFSDAETFDEYPIPATTLKDIAGFLIEGQSYDVLFVEDKPITVNLPASIEVKVVEAPPAVRGNTSGNAQKAVKVESGITVMVPLFIAEGEVIRISTENRAYLGRA
ncbi:MAG: elongation factor P [Opitutae bacterium]|nr:elongation factor P [Opitutae bacterium]